MQHKIIFVNKKPFRVWNDPADFQDKDLLLGFQSDLHLQLAGNLVAKLDSDDNSESVLGLRLLYGLAQEAFFAVLFATLQAPDAPVAWLLLYKNRDLRELIQRFHEGEELPSRVVCPQPGSWEALAVMLLPEKLMQDQTSEVRAKRLGSLWAEWAQEQLDAEMTAEFNGIKHGTRVRGAAPYLVLGSLEFKGGGHGSWFPICERSHSDVVLGVCARSWSGHTLYSRLKLIVLSTSNLIQILRLIHNAGDTSKITIQLPEDEELDSATARVGSLSKLRFGRSWEKNRAVDPLSYEEAIVAYKKVSGPLRFGGEPL